MKHIYYLKTIFFCFLSISLVSASGQILGQTVKTPHFVDSNIAPLGVLNQILPPAPLTEGSSYFEEEWHSGRLTLNDGSILVNFRIRYDIGNSLVEIETKESIRICPTNLLESFAWYDLHYDDSVKFTNCDNYIIDGYGSYIGVFEIMVEGQLNLFSRLEIEIQDSNYLPALDMGSPNKKMIKKEKFYLGSGRKAIALSPKLEENLVHFEPYQEDIQTFAKSEKLKPRKREDIIQLVEYYNKLSTSQN